MYKFQVSNSVKHFSLVFFSTAFHDLLLSPLRAAVRSGPGASSTVVDDQPAATATATASAAPPDPRGFLLLLP